MELRDIKDTALIAFTEDDLVLLSRAATVAAAGVAGSAFPADPFGGYGYPAAIVAFLEACAVAFEGCAATIAMHSDLLITQAQETSLATLRDGWQPMKRTDETGKDGVA